MKILFVIKEEDPIDPMNVELLSALAKREGHETFLAVLQHGDLSRQLERIRPDIVAYSGKTGEHKTFYRINRQLKESLGDRVFTIMGGPHPTFNHRGIQLWGESPEDLPARRDPQGQSWQRHVIPERSDLDALCIGEGDDAWVDLLRARSGGQDIDDIPNLVTRSNRLKYPQPQFRERRVDLDDLPYLDRELVYEKTFLGGFPMRSFMSSRGCPFRCTYCFNYDWNKMYRSAGKSKKLHNRYGVDRLIAEIRAMRELEAKRGYAPVQFIKFYDDMFEFRASPWLEEFAEKFPREVGLPFFCLIRCDIFAHEKADGTVELNEEVLLLLKKAGLRSISMSIEAGNRFVRENILVRDMTEKEIRAAFDLMKKHQIGTFANTILGIPAPVIPRREDAGFDGKLHKAIRETKAAFVTAKKQVEAGRNGGKGYPAELDPILARLDSAAATEGDRGRALELLEGLGLRRSAIEYDLESVQINLDCGVHHTMFPRLDPYPGTVITDFTKAIGAFDGDFEKLHSSYDTTSSFTCFTEREKRLQDNLSFLGQVCAVCPWLWPIAKRWLIHWPLTPLYWILFLAAKTWVIKRHVYPMRFDLRGAIKSAYHIFLVEYKKFFRGDDGSLPPPRPKGWRAAASPAGVLGGRWDE